MTGLLTDLPQAAVLLAVASFAVLAFGAGWHRRVVLQNRRLLEAINNMSQGLCMFDAQTRIVVRQRDISRCTDCRPRS